MTIYNCTPHPIDIYKEEDTFNDPQTRKLILKTEDVQPAKKIPSSGKILSAGIKYLESEDINGIIVKRQVFSGVDDPAGLIEGYDSQKDAVIVSALYANAAISLGRGGTYLTVGGVVYKDKQNPRPVGCLYLIKN
jgi:hypothetical protein